MTSQDFYEFQTSVEGSAKSFVNLPNGDAVVMCEDGIRLLVSEDGESHQIVWSDISSLSHQSTQGDGIASYNAPYPSGDGPDVDCIVQIHIEGSDETGYILVTADDADGPHDGAGKTVYATLAEAESGAIKFAETHDKAK